MGQRGRRALRNVDGVGRRKDLVENAPESATRTKVEKNTGLLAHRPRWCVEMLR